MVQSQISERSAAAPSVRPDRAAGWSRLTATTSGSPPAGRTVDRGVRSRWRWRDWARRDRTRCSPGNGGRSPHRPARSRRDDNRGPRDPQRSDRLRRASSPRARPLPSAQRRPRPPVSHRRADHQAAPARPGGSGGRSAPRSARRARDRRRSRAHGRFRRPRARSADDPTENGPPRRYGRSDSPRARPDRPADPRRRTARGPASPSTMPIRRYRVKSGCSTPCSTCSKRSQWGGWTGVVADSSRLSDTVQWSRAMRR